MGELLAELGEGGVTVSEQMSMLAVKSPFVKKKILDRWGRNKVSSEDWKMHSEIVFWWELVNSRELADFRAGLVEPFERRWFGGRLAMQREVDNNGLGKLTNFSFGWDYCYHLNKFLVVSANCSQVDIFIKHREGMVQPVPVWKQVDREFLMPALLSLVGVGEEMTFEHPMGEKLEVAAKHFGVVSGVR